MSLTLSVLIDEGDVDRFAAWCKGVGDRATGRGEIIPILLSHLEPMVASEKAFLAPHSKSGALAGSLQARAGTGDRPGTMSVFSAPTATAGLLRATWGKHGRKQQRAWAAKLKPKGRRKVFYGPIVHQGHRIVERGPDGLLRQIRTRSGKIRTDPVPFARQAVEAMGDQQAEAAAGEIMDRILGDMNG